MKISLAGVSLVSAGLAVAGLSGCNSLSLVRANANIAFMGDSITHMWTLPTTNFGVPGNTTSQMRARFAREVIGHGYEMVIILGGTNDLRDPNIPVQAEINEAISNLKAMAAEAEEAGLKVVICDIPPFRDQDPRVKAMDSAITAFAKANKYPVVDYYTPMTGHPEYLKDNLHPNVEGYFVMQKALAGVVNVNE